MKKFAALLAVLVLAGTAPAQKGTFGGDSRNFGPTRIAPTADTAEKSDTKVSLPTLSPDTTKWAATGTLKGLTVVNTADPDEPLAQWGTKYVKIHKFPDAAKKLKTGTTLNPQYQWRVGDGTGTKSDPIELHFCKPLTLDSEKGQRGVLIGTITVSEIDPALKKSTQCEWEGKKIMILEYPNAGLKVGDKLPTGLVWKALGSNCFECMYEPKPLKK